MPSRFGADCHGNWLEIREDGMMVLHLPHHKEMFNWPADQEIVIELGKASATRGGEEERGEGGTAPLKADHSMILSARNQYGCRCASRRSSRLSRQVEYVHTYIGAPLY